MKQYNKKDGSGKGKGRPGGLRRNKNTKPCSTPRKNGAGKGKNRKR